MPAEPFTARLAYVDFDGTSALADIDTLNDRDAESFVGRHARKMIDGTQLMCDWLN